MILNIRQLILLSLLLSISVFTLWLSQLDNLMTEKVYAAVSQFFHVDLKALGINATQISDYGHTVAGFVLYGVARLTIRRWWVLPLALIFFVGIEAAQLFSVERQASWMDVLRGWGGVMCAWGLISIGGLFRMDGTKLRNSQ